MRFVAPLLAAVLAAATPLHAASTMEVSRTPPPVFAEHFAPLLTPLADVLEGRSAFPGEDGGGIVLLHEKLFYQGEDGVVFRVVHVVQHAVDQSGVERMGSDIFTFDREREDIFLIDAATLRPDGERMRVEGKGAFIQTPQREAENSLYTSEAELTVIYPRVAPGCTTEATVLIRESQPVMPGEFALAHTFSRGWPAHLQRLVLDLPESALARIKTVTTGSGVPVPASDRYAPGRERRSWTRTSAPYIRWEENGPQFEYRGPTLWLTTLETWDAVATWFQGLIADRSALGEGLEADVDRWTEGAADRAEILARLTEKVSNDVRYVGLEFGLAGYQPHPCAQVWDTRYGDCKDKANLLRAMLAHKGIAAHVALLQTAGLGRVQLDSPSWRQFNHAILAVEDGAGGFIFCDPTIKHLPAGSVGLSDIARDVLVITPRGGVWSRTPDTLDSAIRIGGELVLAGDGALSGWFSLLAEGIDAAGYGEYLNGMDRDGRFRWMQRMTDGFFPGSEVVDVDYTPVAGAVRETRIRAYFTRGPRASGDQALAFPYPANWLPSVDTSGERRFPYVTRRRVESVDVTIALAEGWGPQSIPAAFSAPSAIAEFDAAWAATGGRLEARLSWHPKESAHAAADYPVLQRSVRALTAWLEQPVVLAHAPGTAVVPANPAVAVALEDFPIMPTGKGQLSLLNERYPEESRPAERRAGLEKILQWFPNDTETVFEAQVWLASIDWNDSTHRQFAERTSALIAQHGAQISPGLRAWAGYLEAKARWMADKDPAAIERLESIAEDRTLTPFRRGWAALFAGRYRRELDAAQALAFLLPHDDYESEAQATIVRLLAVLHAELADRTATRAWILDLASATGEGADALVAAALEALIEGDERVGPEQRASAIAAILDAIPADEAHPKAAAARVRWEKLSSQEAAVAGYRAAVHAWLSEIRPTWWTPDRMSQFSDTEGLTKHIDARNDAKDGPGTLDAAMQLILYHQPAIEDLAMYSRWALWWLRNKNLSPALADVIGRGLQALPPESAAEVIQAWHEYAVHLRSTGRLDEARAIYDRVDREPAAKDYQRVDAGGELGMLELKAGNIEAALAAFQRIVPVHNSHKWSVDYLYPAFLLRVGRGEYDQALSLVEAMREQEEKYIDGSDHKVAVKNLLRTARQPEALKRYWTRTAAWIGTWNALLDLNGIRRPAAHELPLEHDFDAANARIEKAVTSKNIGAYLRELDTYARIARAIPIFGGDFGTHADKAGRISASLAQRVCTVGVGLMDGAEPVDPEFDDSVDVWKSIMLGGMGKKEEAAAVGRALFERLGSTHRQGMSGLRLWLAYARGTPLEPEAIMRMEQVLADSADVPDRLLSARILSDSYWQAGDAAAQRALIEREMARTDYDAASEVATVFAARMEELNKAALKNGELTASIDAWLATQDAAWLEHVAPRTLDEPRFADLKPPLYNTPEGLTEAEALKFNLLAARDETIASDVRVSALFAVIVDLAHQPGDVESLGKVYLSAAKLKLLPGEQRARCVYNFAKVLIGRGDTERLQALAGDPLFGLIHEARRTSVRAAIKALQLGDAGEDSWETAAFASLVDVPVDELRITCMKHVIDRLAFAGEFARASALVNAAKDVKVLSGEDKTLTALRLEWTRSIRRVQDRFEFARGLREIVAAVPGANEPVPDKVSARMRFGMSSRLTGREHVIEARYILDRGDLVEDRYPMPALLALGDAQEARIADPMLFPRILDLAMAAPGPDADRAEWVMGALMGCDIDRSDVLARLEDALGTFQRSPEAASRPRTAQAVARARAYFALRTDRRPNPPAVFHDLEPTGMAESERQWLELHFLVTRGRVEEGVRLAEAMPTSTVMQPLVFCLAREGLLAAGHEAEVGLLDETMRDRLGRAMSDLWMYPDRTYDSPWLQVAHSLGASDVVPDAWFERAAQCCATEVRLASLRAHQAHLRRDWKGLKEACDSILREVPDMYDVFYDRAVARYHLGDDAGASDDLEIMLEHSLSHAEYQHALKLYRELRPGAAPIP